MKKIVLLLTLLTTAICQTVYAQHIQEWTSEFHIRYGDYSDETVKIAVLVDMNGSDYNNATYILCTRFGGELLPCSLQFNGQNELMQFHADLKKIRNKYSEWLNIAKQNGVRDLVKEIPIYTQSVPLTLYDGNMNELKQLNTSLKGLFRAQFNSLSLFPNSDSIRIGFNSAKGEDVPVFHIRSVSDLDKILNALNIEKIKAKLNSKVQKQNLFN